MTRAIALLASLLLAIPLVAAEKPPPSEPPAMAEKKPSKPVDKGTLGKPTKVPGKTSSREFIGAAAKLLAPVRDFAPISAAVDREIDRRLAEAHVSASPRADDAEFARRVALDIIGRIPTYEETTWFLASTDPDKRRKWIDDLLASRGYGEHFRDVWQNLIEPKTDANGRSSNSQFGTWLAEQFNSNRGWNEVVHDLLTAQGEISETASAGFILANSSNAQPQPDKLAIATSRLFLGVRLECAQCHDHPFASWKQTDFWAMAAFFSRVRNSDPKGGMRNAKLFECSTAEALARSGPEGSVRVAPNGAIVIPPAFKNAGTVVKPKLLAGEDVSLGEDGLYRVRFADWVTSPENRFFASAAVNRLWSQFFARGLFNPIDDFPADDKTPGVHADLLRLLVREFALSGFDQKHLVRIICNSQAYQRTSRPQPENERDKDLFSHMALKPLTPEALYDSLLELTNVGQIKPPPIYRKGGPRDPRGIFVEVFHTVSDAADPAAFGYGIPQFLRRMNAEHLNVSLAAVHRLGLSRMSRDEAVEAIYVAALSRRPSSEESRILGDYVARHSDAEEAYQGALWILLNSGEFVLNH